MGEEESQQSIWNFDGAELYLIFQIKSAIFDAIEKWDIDTAYRKVRLLRMELDSKLVRERKKIIEELQSDTEQQSKTKKKEKKLTEKKEVDDLIKELDQIYSDYLKIGVPTNEEKSFMIQIIEFVYMELCHIMKKHGLYFREGEDFRLAVLRR